MEDDKSTNQDLDIDQIDDLVLDIPARKVSFWVGIARSILDLIRTIKRIF